METIKVMGIDSKTFKDVEMNSQELNIKADDGRDLFNITMVNGELIISTGLVIKQDGIMLDTPMQILPRYANCVAIKRLPYK